MNIKTKTSAKMILVIFMILLMTTGFATDLFSQEKASKIVWPEKIRSKKQFDDFINNALSDQGRRMDPFVKNDNRSYKQTTTYEEVQKPRPEFGFGSYDVENLQLIALWEAEDNVIAMFRAPDNLVFQQKIGDSAYDGRIVEINRSGKFVKFLQELKLKGEPRDGEPAIKYIEKVVRISN